MRIEFLYPGYENIAPVEVPDSNLMGAFQPRSIGEVEEGIILARGFASPVDAPLLRDAARSNDRVLVLIEDGTRGTPIPRLLPYILAELNEAGIKDDSITLLTAQGTHREMSESELKDKLGDFYGRFALYQHRWLDDSNLHEFGYTSDGTRVTANRLLAQFDFSPYTEIVRMVEAGDVEDIVGAAVLADVAQVIDRSDCIMVSPGVRGEQAERLGFRYAATAQHALEMALERQGRHALIAVLRHGGHILPLVND